ncbi:hypothetical protein ACHQM5_004226 [Ranunculus cassubicifolius]
MPLPWKKKSKINRGVSRFVNDIRASKRGESLVVQTGFPTSLIDLIVKNRNRFNKHRSYIESSAQQIIPNQCPAPAPAYILNSLNTLRDKDNAREERLILNLNSDVKLLEDDAEKSCSKELEECDSGKEICVLNDVQNIRYERNHDVNEGSIGKSMVVIMVFFVLILAVVTKKIAMAMTLVAFLLMFFEKLLNSCVCGYRRWMVPRKLGKRERVRLIEVEESNVVSNFVDFREEFNGMIRGSLGRKVDVNEDLANDEREREHIFFDLDRGIKVSKESEPQILGRRESAKLKAKKFKKYVAKKFGGESRKRRRNKQGSSDQCFALSTGSNTEESLTSEYTDEEDNDEEDNADRDGLIEVSKPCLDTVVLGCSGRTRNWSWSTCIPIMIVLVALVGGRTMALVLSIVCILLHKLYGGT